jgi:medium-chain acyl-[acyl-carrier-protein] hydrolase
MFQHPPSHNRSAVRLFCIPHAGAGPTAYRGWRERLLPEIETSVVQLPGREMRFRERPYQRMEPLVDDLARAVIPWIDRDQIFAFFGYSLGGLIAYETLHEIRRRTGRDAAHLFVSATGAPHCQPPLAPIGDLRDREFIRSVNERYGGIPDAILRDEEFLAALLPTLRADIRVMEAYRRKLPEPLSSPITAFCGMHDATIPIEDVDAWKEYTSDSFEKFVLDEDHLFLQSSHELLIRRVRGALAAPAGIGVPNGGAA